MALPQLQAQTMMQMYEEVRPSSLFLSSLFRRIPGSVGTYGNSLTWDVVRKTNQMAGTIDPCSGSNLNTVDDFTTKQLTPPDYSESYAVHECDLTDRVPGEDPWSAANRNFRRRFQAKMNLGLREATAKIDVAMEEQAAQVLQTGQLSLSGAKPYVADFLPKAAHFPTVAVAWSDSVNAVPLTDIENLAFQIQLNGRKKVTRAIFGRTAWTEFKNSDQVQNEANVLRMNTIIVDPNISERGATLMGTIIVGTYEIECWRYDGTREPFGGGTEVPYVGDDKVILLPNDPRLVIGSLRVPQLLPRDSRIPAALVTPPVRSEGGWDLTPRVWTDDRGTTIWAEMGARAVMIPQGIDHFGCLTT